MPRNLSGRKDSRTDGQTSRKTVTVGRVDQRTHVQVKRGYFRLWTDGRTDGQPENIMPPVPKGWGITISPHTKCRFHIANFNPLWHKKQISMTYDPGTNDVLFTHQIWWVKYFATAKYSIHQIWHLNKIWIPGHNYARNVSMHHTSIASLWYMLDNCQNMAKFGSSNFVTKRMKIMVPWNVVDIPCIRCTLWPLLLTWFNFNPSMDK